MSGSAGSLMRRATGLIYVVSLILTSAVLIHPSVPGITLMIFPIGQRALGNCGSTIIMIMSGCNWSLSLCNLPRVCKLGRQYFVKCVQN